MSQSSEAGADEPATEIFTAAAILNREGHAPKAAERSAQPQHRRGVEPGGEPDKRVAARRGAVLGGALLAGGAALGGAIFAGSEPTAGETAPAGGDGGEGASSDQGLLGPEVSAEAPPEPVVIDPSANAGSLDDGAPVASPSALAGVSTGTGTAQPAVGGAGPAFPEPSSHDAASGGSGGAGGGYDTAFGSGSGGDTSGGDSGDGDTSGGNTSGGDSGDGDTSGGDSGDGDSGDSDTSGGGSGDGDQGGDEGGLLGVGSDEGLLNTGLLDSDSESSGDESESSGDSGGEDDGGGGLLDTGLLS
jgi:hypothetical protein